MPARRNERESRRDTPESEDQGPDQSQTEFQILLRANNELMIRVDRILKVLGQSLSVSAPATPPSTQVSSPGRSRASVVSRSSLASSNTQAARTGLGLPAVIIDLRSAGEETKALEDDPTQTREKIRTALQRETATANVDVVGVKPTSRTTLKRKASRASAGPLTGCHALPGAQLQGEQWFRIKLNDVKKESVFRESGMQREDFGRKFQDENGVAEIKKIIWLSRKKRYGSLAIYLSKQADAEALLSRRIAHVHGEAVFLIPSMNVSVHYDAANVNNTTTKQTDARTRKPAASARAATI
ncbi:hypothetical protein AbraIFM66951_004198 [Aspergillus brasiliensis]|uniref:Uncharacterized protein n=1 Tax=Aspergillus brasiliensis TaxID=319629 RepID=A0A9W6DUC7_9EURO|nr:hypothetical protein AbraCBS73388_004630 [Aspergillus brasiliensis]GKZ50831.1 hypothetical protein AbraIFM66951_004198 [Aspergillus brasiliensis]